MESVLRRKPFLLRRAKALVRKRRECAGCAWCGRAARRAPKTAHQAHHTHHFPSQRPPSRLGPEWCPQREATQQRIFHHVECQDVDAPPRLSALKHTPLVRRTSHRSLPSISELAFSIDRAARVSAQHQSPRPCAHQLRTSRCLVI